MDDPLFKNYSEFKQQALDAIAEDIAKIPKIIAGEYMLQHVKPLQDLTMLLYTEGLITDEEKANIKAQLVTALKSNKYIDITVENA